MNLTIDTNMWGDLANVVALVLPIGFSLPLVRYTHIPYFRFWTYGLISGALTLLIDMGMLKFGHVWQLSVPAMLFYAIAALMLMRTATALQNKPQWDRVILWLVSVAYVVSAILACAGYSFEKAYTLVFFAHIPAHLYLAWAIIKTDIGHFSERLMTALGVAMIGISITLYPALINTPYLWAGFVVLTIEHLITGIGMLVLTLSELNRHLERQNEQLKVVDQLKTNFLSTLNHEFRTPLHIIKLASHLLVSGTGANTPTARQLELLSMASNATNRLTDLFEDTLDYSQMANGTLTYDPVPTDLNAFVTETVRGLQLLFDQNQIALYLEIPEKIVGCDLDRKRIAQVLSNLVTNACKFTPPGGRVVVQLQEESEFAMINVRDTGVGIPEDELEKIFQRFYQVNGSSTRTQGGTGIGLAMCKAIVEDGHGGKIWAKRLEEGTQFNVLLPRKRNASPANRANTTNLSKDTGLQKLETGSNISAPVRT